MSQARSFTYFARTVCIIAAFGMLLQACGKPKNTAANPNAARAGQQGKTPGIDTQLLDLTILQDNMKIRLSKATKTDSADGSTSVKFDFTINDIPISISKDNEKPISVSDAVAMTDPDQVVAVPDLKDYQLSSKGFFDSQNYYLILTLSKNGKESDPNASKKFAIVIGSDAKVQQGALSLDDQNRTTKDFFIFLKDLQFSPSILTTTSDIWKPAKEVTLQIGTTDKLKINMKEVNLSDVSGGKITASLTLNINDVAQTAFIDTNHLLNAHTNVLIDIPLISSSLKYKMHMEGYIDPTSPSEYYMAVTLFAPDVDPKTIMPQFGIIFKSGKDSQKNGSFLILNSGSGALSSDRLMNILKSKKSLIDNPSQGLPATQSVAPSSAEVPTTASVPPVAPAAAITTNDGAADSSVTKETK